MGNLDDQVLDLAGGDRGLATLVRGALERLRVGTAGPELADLANDVLNGHLDVGQMGSDLYAGEFSSHLRAIQQWQDDQPSDELWKQVERVNAAARAITDAGS
jgi:hypothetical protein